MMRTKKKTFLMVVIFSIFSAAALYIFYKHIREMYPYTRTSKYTRKENKTNLAYRNYKHGKWRNFSKQQVKSLSKLGRILFLEEKYPKVNTSAKTFTILNWRYGWFSHERHIQRFTNTDLDPFEQCSVRNCIITYKDKNLETADLVLIEIHFMVSRHEFPRPVNNHNQIWAFLIEESPLNTFKSLPKSLISTLDGIFNWSVTYRMDSDIPIPYGRTVALRQGEIGKFNFEEWDKKKNQNVLITMMNSRCSAKNNRWKYVKKLQKHIDIDRFGGCGQYKCQGYFGTDCKVLSRYKFYLAFENSNCNEYITEKVWWNSFEKNAIPIIMGTTPGILNQMLPPHSYIHINNFINPKDLAKYIVYLNNTPDELRKYLEWRNYFKVFNEHGYFQSRPKLYCRICEALNYNSKKNKTYRDLKKYWVENHCQRGWSSVGDVNVIF